MEKQYITTPIYYINDKPHIGHAYATIVADTFARYHRLRGDKVFFLTGTDENSQKNVEAAKKAGETDLLKYLDEQSAAWEQTWRDLDITNTDFIRTTEDRHKKGVEKFFKTVYERGDIYKGTYKGCYCAGCEAFVRETDLVEGLCPLHKKVPQVIEEENYFFRCSKYRDQLLAHIDSHPEFVEPESRRNEIVNYIKDHFEDVSISRKNVLGCGIPLPIDAGQVVYVWFDALINYLTGIGYGSDEKQFAKWWPADVHIVGKDIIKFHCALWPAMLLSAGLPLPRKVFAHGFFTINGDKVSKSLGNAIDPIDLARQFGLDPLRYFLLSEIPFGGDGDFSFDRVRERYASDLSKGLGNFVSRVTTLASKVSAEELENVTGKNADRAQEILEKTWGQWENGFETYQLDKSLAAISSLLRWGDKYMEEKKPWALAKEHPAEFALCLAALAEVVRHLTLLIKPILPATAEKIEHLLGVSEFHANNPLAVTKRFGAVTIPKVEKADPLFPPLTM